MKVLIILLFALIHASDAFAQPIYSNMGRDGVMIYYEIVDSIDKTVAVTSCNRGLPAYHGRIDIPSLIRIGDADYRVVGIGAMAFAGCDSLTEVNIPSSVTDIGGGAFIGCRMLKSICLPHNLRVIRELTFCDCTGLTSVILPDSIYNIQQHAFGGCTAIDSLSLPDTLHSIGDFAFFGCRNLKHVDFQPTWLQHIGDMAFGGTRWYEERPDGLITIGTSVYDYKVDDTCLMMIDVSDLPQPVRMVVEENPFRHKYDKYLSPFKAVVLPDGITTIGSHAFFGCRNLCTIHIPVTVTRIEEYAFGRCHELTEIHVKWQTPLSINPDTYNGLKQTACTLFVPRGTAHLYRQAEGWKEFGQIVEE